MNKIEEAYKEYYCKGDALTKCAFQAEEQGFKAGAEWVLSEAAKIVESRMFKGPYSEQLNISVKNIKELLEDVQNA